MTCTNRGRGRWQVPSGVSLRAVPSPDSIRAMRRKFKLVERVTFQSEEERIAYLTEKTNVLAKKRRRGGEGCWLPAKVDKKEVDAEGKIWVTVLFMQEGPHFNHYERLPSDEVEAIFTDSPLKYDADKLPVWPTSKTAEHKHASQAAGPEHTPLSKAQVAVASLAKLEQTAVTPSSATQSAQSTSARTTPSPSPSSPPSLPPSPPPSQSNAQDDDAAAENQFPFVPLPGPVSDVYNHRGPSGIRQRPVDRKANGDLIWRTAYEWEDITTMKQTTGAVRANAPKMIAAQYRGRDGILDVQTAEGTLVRWTGFYGRVDFEEILVSRAGKFELASMLSEIANLFMCRYCLVAVQERRGQGRLVV